MNVADQLRSLTTDAPAGDLDTGHALYREGRRRLVRRRSVTAGGGLVAIALLVAVGAPLLNPSSVVVEDGFAEQPEQLPPTDPAEPGDEEEPVGETVPETDGGPEAPPEEGEEAVGRTPTTVAVGGATLTIPAVFEVMPTTPDDPTPCLRGSAEPTFFLAPDGAPAQPDGLCPQGEPTTPSVLATTASTVPPAWLPGEGQDPMTAVWVDFDIDGAPAQRATDPNMPGLIIVRSVELDLYIEISDRDQDPALIDELLDSIRQSS